MFFFLSLYFFSSFPVFAAEPVASESSTHPLVTIEGTLLEKGTKKPLADQNVYILPSTNKGISDAEGHFRIEGVPEGSFRIVVNVSGYERLEEEDFQEFGAPARLRTLYLPRVSYQIYETTIYGKENKRDDSTRSIKASVAMKLPGANNDPIKAVQNLPGVSRAAGFSSQVIIQGAAPQDTRYTIDGHEVPIIFHFGGFSSVILPESLDRVDYLSAGYGVEYGRAMGGLVGAWTKKPERQRFKGFVYADVINAGAAIETPIGESGSLMVGVRRSYIGNVLKAVAKEKEDSDFSLTAAPTFQDFTLVYDQPLSPKDDFRFDAVASQDSFDFVLKKPPENDPNLRGNFQSQTSFIRFIPQWTHRHSDRTTSRFSLGLGRDWIKFVLDDQFFRLASYSITNRIEVEQKWSEAFSSYFGIDNNFSWATVSLVLPDFYNSGGVSNPTATAKQLRVNAAGSYHKLGAYWNNDVKISPLWSIKPGIRFDYFTAVNEGAVAPRFAIKRELSSFSSLRLATGLYYQPPREQESNSEIGNPDLKAPRSVHLALTYERDFREGASNGWTFQGGPFARLFDRLIIPSTALIDKNGVASPENYNNEGRGRSVGLEALLRFDANPWNGWLSYTLSRSTRREPGQAWFASPYDQTHNINLIVGRDLPRNWRVAGRFRLVTGNPLTPVTGSVFDSDNDAYIPVRGPFYSDRINSFYQLDIRADKKWIYEKIIITAYVDVQNITNHANVESVSYAYDYSKRADVKGLPIIPSIGLKGEF
ncbi:MAG: TonB-dependent receptor plug domain-containing protein [Cryobacterium sp.]|nr:TonB-dependent receptor plug domain-containing protein [Oligoflexia bacterium]